MASPATPTSRNQGRASPAMVELVRMIAGEGTVDERCHRILEVFRPWWGFPEPDDPE